MPHSPEHPTHGISRDTLSPHVREYDDNLDAQARALFDKYRITHYDEAALMKATKAGTISTKDLYLLRDLLVERDHIRRTGEVSPEALQVKLKEAREILGPENVYGPERVKAIFNTDIRPSELPPIPYSREDLEKAKELNMKLILRVSHDALGNPLTPKRIEMIVERLFDAESMGEIINNGNALWFSDEPLFVTETPAASAAEWKLVTTDPLPGSESKNYNEQTMLLRETLRKLGWLTAEEAEEFTDEKFQILRRLLVDVFDENGRQEATQILSELKINRHHRRTFSQALYDTVLIYFSHPDEPRPLEKIHDWTASRLRSGDFIVFGFSWDEDGTIANWHPSGWGESIGVCLSR